MFDHRPFDQARLLRHKPDRIAVRPRAVGIGQLAKGRAAPVEDHVRPLFSDPAGKPFRVCAFLLVVVKAVRAPACIKPRAGLFDRVAIGNAV
jgi:hypothetical protein